MITLEPINPKLAYSNYSLLYSILQLNLSITATLNHYTGRHSRGGHSREVAIRVEKSPGHCKEVAISRGLTVSIAQLGRIWFQVNIFAVTSLLIIII